MKKLSVAKTKKMFVGGAFVRSESGRSLNGLCLASRKDLRDAVEKAQGGLKSWSSKSAYNRGQILYRMAEMWSERGGDSKSVEALLYFAGFCDKYLQLSSNLNPIAGSFANFTAPEPVGVVVHFVSPKASEAEFFTELAAILCSGSSVISCLDVSSPLAEKISEYGEMLATSDVPNGTVNIFTGHNAEILEIAASHRDIPALVLRSADAKTWAQVQKLGAESMKRIIGPKAKFELNLSSILHTVEWKTIWQPVGF